MKERSSPLLRSDARPVYAVSLPLDSKLPHLPRSASSSDYFIGFSPLPIYTGNEDFLRCLWRCSGFLKDSTITSKYVVALTREKKEISATKKKERERERQRSFRLSISFNPTFPCRLLLSIYYKLFHWSPREAACPANRENTRVFHSIKFDKVRRRYRDSREFAVTVNRRWYKLVDSRLDHIDDIPARQPRDSFWKP